MSTSTASTVRTDDRASDVIIVAAVGITISTIAVVLRFWSRAVNAKLTFWWDDWIILATTVFSHAFQILGIAWTRFGLGQHIENVSYSNILPGTYISHASITLYAVCIWLIKISALFLFARIFKHSIVFRRVLWTMGTCVTAWGVCTVIIPWFNCTPVSKTLDPFGPGVCFDRMGWYLASAVINALLDLSILLLPLPVIWRLQMTQRRKIMVTIVFVLGYCSAFLSFARFIIIVRDPTVMSLEVSADPYWHTVPLLLISYFEAPIAIVALCSPAISQLGTHFTQTRSYAVLRSLLSSRKSRYKSDGSKVTQDAHIEYHDKSSSTYSKSPVGQPQQQPDWSSVQQQQQQNWAHVQQQQQDWLSMQLQLQQQQQSWAPVQQQQIWVPVQQQQIWVPGQGQQQIWVPVHQQLYWSPVPPGSEHYTTFANHRTYDDSQESTAPAIPTGAIVSTREMRP